MENIYTQAVADAKAVRESAMANAKAAIQEAFEPKIKEMLKKHIEETEGLEEEYDEVEETYGQKDMEEEYNEYDETMSPSNEASPTVMDEKTLDEILAELDGLEEADEIEEAEAELEEAYEVEEAKEEMEEAKEEEEEETEEETEEDEDGKEETEETTEDTKVVELTLGDLVDAIKAAMESETSAAAPAAPADDDISLDEILAELEEEMKDEGAAGSGDYMDEAKKKHKAKEDKEKMKAEKELEEAKKAIETMRAELNEVNLLNAKLLYVNKIFKSKSLSEAQKVKVLNAFDKATTVKEVKNTYSIVSESIAAEPKKQLKESYGFASKPAGIAPKANTVESDPFIARMQKLAGL